jgi:dynein heavy chain
LLAASSKLAIRHTCNPSAALTAAVAYLPQGMTKAAGSVEDSYSGVRLWAHEVLRVFYDRLIDEPDRLRVGRLLEELTEKHFKQQLGRLLGLAGAGGAVSDEELLGGLRGLIFGDFMVPGAGALCKAA